MDYRKTISNLLQEKSELQEKYDKIVSDNIKGTIAPMRNIFTLEKSLKEENNKLKEENEN
jgi:hypothetical protein